MVTNENQILTDLSPFYVLSSIKCYHKILATISFLKDISAPESIFSPNQEDTLIIPVQLEAKSTCNSFHMDFCHPSVKPKYFYDFSHKQPR